ncbi:MAG: Crp/Fnr family transcriptional regulator [Niabella sp.]
MQQEKKPYDASRSFLYAYCMKEWWPALDANRQVLHYKKGATIFKEGDRVTGIYFMLSGLVKVHKRWDQEKELIVRFARNQDIIGHRGLSTSSQIYPITATTLTPVTVCYVSVDFFQTTFKANKEFAYHFMMFMAEELRLSEIRMRNLAHMVVRARLAGALIAFNEQFGETDNGYIDCTLSKQDIAAYVGTAYETIYKILIEFTELGYIQTDGKKIALLNKAKLKSIIR